MPVKKPLHDPVLLNEILDLLVLDQTNVVFDGTLGLGGHAEAILTHCPKLDLYVGCDLDQQHLDMAKERLSPWAKKLKLFQANFSEIEILLPDEVGNKALSILLDLGVCSNHLDDGGKGFSFQSNGPLVMSFDGTEEPNCETIVNTASEVELSQILKDFGEEPLARKIAKNIVQHRTHKAIKTTQDLRAIVESSVYPKDRKKSLMRVFQAFRIATNDELGHLKRVLESSIKCMKSGDRIGIIAYHSLEDRIVKKFFKEGSKPETISTKFDLHQEVAPAKFKLITKKAVTPTKTEISQNPRARSARLRIAEKI